MLRSQNLEKLINLKDLERCEIIGIWRGKWKLMFFVVSFEWKKCFKWFYLWRFWINNEHLRILTEMKVIERLNYNNWKNRGVKVTKKLSGDQNHN